MDLLDNFQNIVLDSYNKEHLKESLEEYEKYLNELLKISYNDRIVFLNTLKRQELINNQEMNCEDSFLAELDSEYYGNDSIEFMTNILLDTNNFSKEKIRKIHRILMRNTKDDYPENRLYRQEEAFIGAKYNDKVVVSYIPPSPGEINCYMRTLIKYLNHNNKEEENILLKPIVAHAYVAALQPFANGNTRLARLLQYGEIFKLSRDVLDIRLEKPALYFSKTYLLSGIDYRENIKELVDTKEWNQWIKYNLYKIDDQLYYNGNELTKYKNNVLRKKRF